MSVRARLAVVVVLVAVVAAACSDDSAAPADESSSSSAELPPSTESVADGGLDETAVTTSAPDTSTSIAAATTSVAAEPLTLEERITANMQGAQRERLDIWPDSEAGGSCSSTTATGHRRSQHDWGAPARSPATTANEAPTHGPSPTPRASRSSRSTTTRSLKIPTASAFGIERLTAVFTGSREVDGRIVYDFGFTAGLGTPEQPLTGTRTVCSDQWNDPEPCGLALPGFEMSTPPN